MVGAEILLKTGSRDSGEAGGGGGELGGVAPIGNAKGGGETEPRLLGGDEADESEWPSERGRGLFLGPRASSAL